MILLDQFAYVGDILNFYIDRMAAEAYIQSAVMRESVLNLAYAFGYVPTPQTAASAVDHVHQDRLPSSATCSCPRAPRSTPTPPGRR